MRDNLNLTPKRGPNVWDEQPEGDRWKSEIGGAVMVAAGAAAAVVGGRMLYRAIRAGRRRAEADERSRLAAGPGPEQRSGDLVSQESDDSFPASDAPSWTAQGALPDLPRRRP